MLRGSLLRVWVLHSAFVIATALSSFKRGYVRPNTVEDSFFIWVQFGDDTDSPFSLQAGSVTPVYAFPDINTYVLRLDSQSQYSELQNDPNVVRIERDSERRPSMIQTKLVTEEEKGQGGRTEDFERHLNQAPYNLEQIQALQAHEFTTGAGVKVCIIDSGIADHDIDLDLDSAQFDGFDGGELPWNEDLLGHGTFMSGIIAANSDNNIGVIGVSETCNDTQISQVCHSLLSYQLFV